MSDGYARITSCLLAPTRVAQVREMEAKQAESRRRLDDLFYSLLHRAFEGEL